MTKIFSSKYTFIVAGILFLGCSYWIYKNVNVNDLIGKPPTPPVETDIENSQEAPKMPKYQIRNNDIVEVVSPDAVKLIIDGDKIENFESFYSISVSPDEKKICFSVSTITPVWLYVANIDGTGIKQITTGVNCAWSPDSTKILYNNHTTDVSPIDIYAYDYAKGKSVNLTTSQHKEGFITHFNNPKWENNNLISAIFIRMLETNIATNETGSTTVEVSESLFN